jgi:hypothetical protein
MITNQNCIHKEIKSKLNSKKIVKSLVEGEARQDPLCMHTSGEATCSERAMGASFMWFETHLGN